MNKAIISFVISLVIGFGLGYLVFDVMMGDSGSQPQVAAKSDTSTKPTTKDQGSESKETAATTTAVDQDNILSKRGCLGCHSVEALNLKAGQVGPDLSHAFVEVKDKHGMPIEKFLTKPDSAVMSGVLGKKPLTDDERKQVLEILKKASEAK
ncbi:cytochrome C [Neobacillus niacini]|uniref:cytochrome C n=1 Tax=Neobacillus niacini TaxID=86668 RepID=UPI002856CA8D|nr:cytochrome C [Neobacillus niacini]MDR6999430.1 cytochrome c551/c552 [Neobacillus niacini]